MNVSVAETACPGRCSLSAALVWRRIAFVCAEHHPSSLAYVIMVLHTLGKRLGRRSVHVPIGSPTSEYNTPAVKTSLFRASCFLTFFLTTREIFYVLQGLSTFAKTVWHLASWIISEVYRATCEKRLGSPGLPGPFAVGSPGLPGPFYHHSPFPKHQRHRSQWLIKRINRLR